MAAQAGQIWGEGNQRFIKSGRELPGYSFLCRSAVYAAQGGQVASSTCNQLSGWYGGWLEVAVCVS